MSDKPISLIDSSAGLSNRLLDNCLGRKLGACENLRECFTLQCKTGKTSHVHQ